MAPRPCYWTRKLELKLVEFVRERDYMWKPISNTNHHIQLKYQAYAEFAATLGRGFTARSVRDRWVNIRSTFSHNLRKVDRSRMTASSPEEVYVPCWPLWKPMQFLRDSSKMNDVPCENYQAQLQTEDPIKEEIHSEVEDIQLNIRQQGQRTDRPRRKSKLVHKSNRKTKCKEIIDNLLTSMKPLVSEPRQDQYWFFGKHVADRLNAMRTVDSESACQDIMKLLDEWQPNIETT